MAGPLEVIAHLIALITFHVTVSRLQTKYLAWQGQHRLDSGVRIDFEFDRSQHYQSLEAPTPAAATASPYPTFNLTSLPPYQPPPEPVTSVRILSGNELAIYTGQSSPQHEVLPLLFWVLLFVCIIGLSSSVLWCSGSRKSARPSTREPVWAELLEDTLEGRILDAVTLAEEAEGWAAKLAYIGNAHGFPAEAGSLLRGASVELIVAKLQGEKSLQELETAKKKVKALHSKLDSANTELKGSEIKEGELREQLSAGNDQLGASESRKYELHEQLAETVSKLNASEIRERVLRKQLSAADKELEAHASKEGELQGQLSAANHKLAGSESNELELRKQVSEAKVKGETALEDLKLANTKEVKALRNALSSLDGNLERSESSGRELARQLSEAKSQGEEARQDLDSSKEYVETLRGDIKSVSANLKDSKSTEAQLREEFIKTEVRRDELSNLLSEASEKLLKLEEQANVDKLKAQQQKEDRKAEREKLTTGLEAVTKEKDHWKKEANDLEETVAELEDAIMDSLGKELEGESKVRDALTEKLEVLQSTLQSLQAGPWQAGIDYDDEYFERMRSSTSHLFVDSEGEATVKSTIKLPTPRVCYYKPHAGDDEGRIERFPCIRGSACLGDPDRYVSNGRITRPEEDRFPWGAHGKDEHNRGNRDLNRKREHARKAKLCAKCYATANPSTYPVGYLTDYERGIRPAGHVPRPEIS